MRSFLQNFSKRHGTVIIFGFIVLLAAWLRYDRINYPRLPGGDEPSWMGVAAELARGNGYTSRWLEHYFLEPKSLPRPDDYRFPAFTLTLAAAFRIFGISHETGLRTTLVIYLLSLSMLFILARRWAGDFCALCAAFVSALSLYQIHWSTHVYSEPFYALVFYLIMYAALFLDYRTNIYWVTLGTMLGLCYYVRPNIMLAYPVFLIFGLIYSRKYPIKKYFILGCIFMMCVPLPWWIRNIIYFHNPLHVGGGGGFFYAEYEDFFRYGAADYIVKYGLFHTITRPVFGTIEFIKQCIEFEHGLVIPFAPIAIYGLYRIPKTPGLIFSLVLIVLQLLCSFWVSLTNWAGPRFMYFAFPLFYLAGVYGLMEFWKRRLSPFKAGAVSCVILGQCLLTIFNPHRYYFRKHHVYERPRPVNVNEIVGFLQKNMSMDDIYMGIGQGRMIAFLTDRKCVSGPYLDVRNNLIPRAMEFNTKYLVILKSQENWLKQLVDSYNKNNSREKVKVPNTFRGQDWLAFTLEKEDVPAASKIH